MDTLNKMKFKCTLHAEKAHVVKYIYTHKLLFKKKFALKAKVVYILKLPLWNAAVGNLGHQSAHGET